MAGTAALVGALEDAGGVCWGGEINGINSHDGTVYFETGLGGYSGDEGGLNCHSLATKWLYTTEILRVP